MVKVSWMPAHSVMVSAVHAATAASHVAKVVASLGASDLLVALGEESGLPDPTGAVVAFAFLFAAFAYTQFDMVGVTDQEELEGAEGARRARDALARKRGYFRK